MNKDKAINIVLEATQEIKDNDGSDTPLTVKSSTPLVGTNSALDSMALVQLCLSLEDKASDFGFDFDWQHTPVDVGLTWMISETKGPYQAREALLAAKQYIPENKFVGFVLEGDEVPLSGDKVVLDGKAVGLITSSTGSPALGVPIAMGYVGVELALIGEKVQIDCGGSLRVARVTSIPFIDPERKLMKA